MISQYLRGVKVTKLGLPGFFLCIFSSRSSAVEGTSQAVMVQFDQLKVLASLSLFLKSEKIPALLYLG
jgi:hypothetical protein